MTNATALAKGGEVIAVGMKVVLVQDDDGEPIDVPPTSGTVERIDGAVAWVRWFGTRNAVPYLLGRLEVLG